MSGRHFSKYSGQQVGKWLYKKNLAFSHDSVSAHFLGKRTGGGFLSVFSKPVFRWKEEKQGDKHLVDHRQVAEPRLLG